MNKKKKNFREVMEKYAIPNLSLVIILCYGFGYILQYVNAGFLDYLTLNPYAICHGQIWRLLTWVLVPPDTSNIFFILVAMMFYYSIGTSLERAWGTYEYNVYIWLGVLITIVGAFAAMAVYYIMFAAAGVTPDAQTLQIGFTALARYFSTYYVNMSIFLAYAATFPNAVVLLWFIIPVKVKWMGIIYGVILGIDFLQMAAAGRWYICISMAASLANFLIFWIRQSRIRRFSPQEIKRRKAFRKAVKRGKSQSTAADGGGRFSSRSGQTGNSSAGQSAESASKMRPRQAEAPRHRCAICGRTELDDPSMEFRYCSRCQGSYEFCQEHLFRHQHAVNGSGPIAAEENVTIEPGTSDER